MPSLGKLLSLKSESEFLVKLRDEINLQRLSDISREIDRAIDPTTTADLKLFLKMKCVFFCIQRNVNDTLDLSRRAY